MKNKSNLERFNNHIEPITESGCWLWTAFSYGINKNRQYGKFKLNGKIIKAHRASYILHNGSIPDGMHVLHRCDITLCVNPNHLFLGTNYENVQDCISKNRKAILKGTNHQSAKLTYEDINYIRNNNHIKLKNLAEKYNVSIATISRIKNRISYQNN